MPVPCFNVINGGSHAGNKLPFQEYFVIPTGAADFKEGMLMGTEVPRRPPQAKSPPARPPRDCGHAPAAVYIKFASSVWLGVSHRAARRCTDGNSSAACVAHACE